MPLKLDPSNPENFCREIATFLVNQKLLNISINPNNILVIDINSDRTSEAEIESHYQELYKGRDSLINYYNILPKKNEFTLFLSYVLFAKRQEITVEAKKRYEILHICIYRRIVDQPTLVQYGHQDVEGTSGVVESVESSNLQRLGN